MILAVIFLLHIHYLGLRAFGAQAMLWQGATVSVLSRYCRGTVSILLQYCHGTVSVLSRYCLGTLSVLSLNNCGTVLVLSHYCCSTVLVLSQYCLCTGLCNLVINLVIFGHIWSYNIFAWKNGGGSLKIHPNLWRRASLKRPLQGATTRGHCKISLWVPYLISLNHLLSIIIEYVGLHQPTISIEYVGLHQPTISFGEPTRPFGDPTKPFWDPVRPFTGCLLWLPPLSKF